MADTSQLTLADVARLAGVSRSTVSKVLNSTDRVSPATAERVWAAVQRLDFQPNSLARSLATGRSLTIGVIAKGASSTFSMPVLVGASEVLGKADLASLLYNLGDEPGGAPVIMRKLQSRRVDGLLVIGEGGGEPLPSVSQFLHVPVVYAFGYSEAPEDTSFVPDGRQAGRLAAEHLLGLGRRRIAHITAAGDRAANERAEGLRDALDAAGLELALDHPLRGQWTRSWGAQGAQHILRSGADVDAIFCGDDWIALGARAELRSAGHRVPEDIAIVGFDNLAGHLGKSFSSLTTIDPHLQEVGSLAAAHLLRRLGGAEAEPGLHYVDCSLIPAASTIGAGSDRLDDIEVIESL